MDAATAEALAKEVVGQEFEGFTIRELSRHGKSAAVFRATNGSDVVAVKIFARTLVERFGRETQLQRINRELRLKEFRHPNLVRILGGGAHDHNGLLFVVMEWISYRPLSDVIDSVPRDRIWDLISQVAKAARFLEDLSLAHRDIKPDNISVSDDFSHAVLMDLGVLRPFGPSTDARITDMIARPFIGTLQYTSPEMLVRHENDSPEGWRAIAFYQLGAVLHDLIMKRRLFDEFVEPFAVLSNAVQHEVPKVVAQDVPAQLVLLARNCLLKDPGARLRFVTWDSFDPKPEDTTIDALKERIRQRAAIENEPGTAQERRRVQSDRELELLEIRIRDLVRQQVIAAGTFPPVSIHKSEGARNAVSFVVTFDSSKKHALRRKLVFAFKLVIEADEPLAVTVAGCAFLTDQKGAHVDDQLKSIRMGVVFQGVFDDQQFSTAVTKTLLEALDASQTTQSSDAVVVLYGVQE